MSLLQSLFTDKKQSSQLHSAYNLGMQQARHYLWEAALQNFLIAVDLANTYKKAQVMLCLCHAHQVDDESVKIHLRHLQKADSGLYARITALPGAARVLCLENTVENESPPFTRTLVEIRDRQRLPSLLDLRLTPSVYIQLITNMEKDGYISHIKLKSVKNPIEIPDRCCPQLTEKGKEALNIWESTFTIFAENVMALIDQS